MHYYTVALMLVKRDFFRNISVRFEKSHFIIWENGFMEYLKKYVLNYPHNILAWHDFFLHCKHVIYCLIFPAKVKHKAHPGDKDIPQKFPFFP